ncbi:MAG TPA: hypothetical protein VEF71_08700 [Streptosporangiaceae bacterium]|nr:hypothetical protein [Streptosporangiaceae bacterium]
MSEADQVRDHQARCLVHLISLRMLAGGEAGTPPTRWVVVEIARATGAILAEAEAAGRAALAAADDGSRGGETFLRVRLDRLATAANDAIAAARAGNLAELRQHLYRFDALTSAIWTVHDSVYGPGRTRRPALRQVSPAP